MYLMCRQTVLSIDGNSVRKGEKRKMKIRNVTKQEEGIDSSRSEAAIGGTSAYDTHRENLKVQII